MLLLPCPYSTSTNTHLFSLFFAATTDTAAVDDNNDEDEGCNSLIVIGFIR